jgi:hypothetical protein
MDDLGQRMTDIQEQLRDLGPNWVVSEVRGQHKKPCDRCGADCNFSRLYIHDLDARRWNPSEKICEECFQSWYDERMLGSSEDEGDLDVEGHVAWPNLPFGT